jgi:hypothetical protein
MMRRTLMGVLVAGVMGTMSLPLFAQENQRMEAQQAQPGAEVPVRIVVLYSSGVGYFEHSGTVTGEATTEVRFKTEQINDILKSLLLEDLDGGRVGVVAYPSQDPIEKILRSFQIDITGDPSLAELLKQLRGARVSLQWGAEEIRGTILGLEKQPKAVGETTIEVWVLNLLADGAIRSVELSEVRRLELEDPQLRQELNLALSALAGARDQDKKPVSIQFRGEGERQVRIGYVVEAPVWKTSYRLVLPGEGAAEGPGRLQGWAIVENQTDNDWENVQLSLVSGRPISFIQELYEPLYVQRPVVEPELWAGLRPQMYRGGMAEERLMEAADFDDAAPRRDRMLGRAEMPMAAAPAQDAMQTRRPMDPTRSIAASASAAQLGELFQYTVGNVSLSRQRSAMIPIITDEVEIERLSIYNQQVLAENPLTGARLKNTTGKHLLQGPITVLDAQAYAGDAQIENLPPGQERLISYGVDLDVRVDATKGEQTQAIQTARIVRGVLHLSRKHVAKQEYRAENRGSRDKVLMVEHPLKRGWELTDTPSPVETTEDLYRFRQELPAGEGTTLAVTEQIVRGETIAILPADVGQLVVYQRSGQVPREVREALAEAIRRKEAMVQTQRQIERRQQQAAEITREQERMRENMRTIDRNSQYYNRLLTKMDEQETQIEQLQTEVRELQTTLERQQRELEDYVGGLTVG